MCLAPSVRNKTEVSAFMAKRIAGRDVYRTKICTNSTCYQTMWCQWLPSILLILDLKSRVALCFCYWGTSLNSPILLLLLTSKVQFFESILYLNCSLHLCRRWKERAKKSVAFLFFSVLGLREDLRWIPFSRYRALLAKESIPKKQLNKESFKHTFGWNTWSYDKTYKALQPSCILACSDDCVKNGKCIKVTLSQLSTIPY